MANQDCRLAEIEQILRPLTDDPDTEIPHHVPLDLLGFDSLDMLDAMYRLQNHFGVDLSDVEPRGLTVAILAMEIRTRAREITRRSLKGDRR